MMHAGDDTGMWDEEDGFFYDVLRMPDGTAERLKVRSMVGLLPLCAVTRLRRRGYSGTSRSSSERLISRFLEARPELRAFIHDPARHRPARPAARPRSSTRPSSGGCSATMLDENEFLSPYGIRSLSRYHAEHPLRLRARAARSTGSAYLPAESDSGMFGGNSNWRGPIWMPVNALIIRALLQYHAYYGDDFTIECPTGSGRLMTLDEVAEEISRRLASDLPTGQDRPPTRLRRQRRQLPGRPAAGGIYILFYEYFHGDNGAGLGASHQTGWTGRHRADHRICSRATFRAALGPSRRGATSARTPRCPRTPRGSRTRTLATGGDASRPCDRRVEIPDALPGQHPRPA